MYPHVFCGDLAKDQKVKILLLGESHHWNRDDYGDTPDKIARRREKKKTYSTKEVLNRYLDNCRKNGHSESAHTFFDKIVRSFGLDPNTSRELFWQRVYFGNYIDTLCGVGDDRARILLSDPQNCEKYNDKLFRFIADHDIDVLCCFSRGVYAKLPGYADHAREIRDTIDGLIIRHQSGTTTPDRIYRCVYLPDTPHDHTQINLKKELEVYGMLHPSGRYGFDPENYAPVLRPLIDL